MSGLVLLFSLGLLLTGGYAFFYGIPFADTYTYLDPGRNLLQGRGFVTRFNVVHGWSGRLDHPGLAYYNPLYGFLLAIVWRVLDNAGYVGVVATALPCCLNALLLAALVRRPFGVLTALLSGTGYLLIPSTWRSIALISAEHPAVTIVLLCLLLIQYYLPRHPRAWLMLGALLGVGCLFKVSIGMVIPGLVAAIVLTQGGAIRQRLGASMVPVGRLILGVAVVLGGFTLVCRFTVGEWYPSYPAMAQNWSLATQYGGHYVAGSPAVQPDPTQVPRARQRIGFVRDNLTTFARSLWGELGPLTLTLVLALVGTRTDARRTAIFLLSVGASLALGHAASFNWFPLRSEPSPARYILYLAAFWYPVAVYGLVQLTGRLSWTAIRNPAAVALWLAVSARLILSLESSLRQVETMQVPRFARLQQSMIHSAQLVGPDDLVAVAGGGLTICGAVFLERPVVPLPQGRMDTPRKMRAFIDLFNPKLVIPAKNRSADTVLPQMGYKLLPPQGPRAVRVYLRTQPPHQP